MLLLVGLGNPGKKYENNRHNIGFMAADAIAEAHGFSPFKSKFQALFCEGQIETQSGAKKALLAKPQTFMNESGQAVRAIAKFYKIAPENVVVFYDELDVAPGRLKVKQGGGAAGHNGIRSIDAHIGNNFNRIRIGIGHPGDKAKVHNYVLGDFAKADERWCAPMLQAIADSAPHLFESNDRFAIAVSQIMSEQGFSKRQNNGSDKKKTSDQADPKQQAARQQKGAPHPQKPSDAKAAPTNPFAELLGKLKTKTDGE